jgi:hypothetical protein
LVHFFVFWYVGPRKIWQPWSAFVLLPIVMLNRYFVNTVYAPRWMIFNGREENWFFSGDYSNRGLRSIQTGLPDFSWHKNTKMVKNT